MTLIGWAFMFLSWVVIVGLTFFCFSKIFRKEKVD